MSTARGVRCIGVFGTVQGVGFRSFVYRVATGLGLDGRVFDTDGHREVAGRQSHAWTRMRALVLVR